MCVCTWERVLGFCEHPASLAPASGPCHMYSFCCHSGLLLVWLSTSLPTQLSSSETEGHGTQPQPLLGTVSVPSHPLTAQSAAGHLSHLSFLLPYCPVSALLPMERRLG
jgi:hypothetical protein